MPAISDLDRARHGFLDGLRVGAGTIPADDLDAGVFAQPGGEGLRRAVGQHVDHAPGLDVDQHGAVGAALAERELVHAQDPRRAGRDLGRLQQFEQPGASGPDVDRVAEPFTGPPAQLDRDRPQPLREAQAGAPVAFAEPLDLLDEGQSAAALAVAEVAADPQAYRQPLADHRPLAQRPPVGRVDPSAEGRAVRAPRRLPPRIRLDHQQFRADDQPLQTNIDTGKQHILDRMQAHTRGILRGNDSSCQPLTWPFADFWAEPDSRSAIRAGSGAW